MSPACQHLLALYARPRVAATLAPSEWEGVIRLGRASGLLARLAERLGAAGCLDGVPAAVADQLTGARRLAEAHHRNVRWEIRQIRAGLRPRAIPFMLLKGAAYVLGDLPAASGRVFTDVDILVPEDRLADAERALEVQGWVTTHRHPYDQRYYRRWMHELPPMRHVHRATNLDVHHALLPRTAARHPDPERLWQAARPLPGWPGVWLPGPEDLVLHAAAHLFADGELENGLRDLTDLDGLLRHFGEADDGFLARLGARAREMELEAPLGDALHWSQRLLATPVPEGAAPWPRRGATAPGRDLLFRQGLRPDHPLCAGPWNRFARWLLFIRSHLLRMPLYRLLPHLARKGLRPAQRESA